MTVSRKGVPKHIRHAVTPPKKRPGRCHFPYVIECICGWHFIGKTFERCYREGIYHIGKHTDEHGNS